MKKAKKVPQRGLGVAQLEKIRVEQLKKQEIYPTNSSSSSTIPFTDILHPNSIPFSKPLNVSASVGRGNANHQKGFSLPSNVHFVYESNHPLSHLPSFLHASHQFLPSSPVVHYQMEHPSIQTTYDSSNYTPLWPNEEEKIIGMKRPYPFSMDIPPAPPFHLKYPPSYVAPISRMDESVSFSNRSDVASDPGIIREVPIKTIISPQPTTREEVKEDDFLSLGPPVVVQPQISSGNKQVFANSGYQGQGMLDFGCQQSQESNEDCFPEPRSSNSIQTKFFSFLPSTRNPADEQNAALMNNCCSEVGEDIDLSLKL